MSSLHSVYLGRPQACGDCSHTRIESVSSARRSVREPHESVARVCSRPASVDVARKSQNSTSFRLALPHTHKCSSLKAMAGGFDRWPRFKQQGGLSPAGAQPVSAKGANLRRSSTFVCVCVPLCVNRRRHAYALASSRPARPTHFVPMLITFGEIRPTALSCWHASSMSHRHDVDASYYWSIYICWPLQLAGSRFGGVGAVRSLTSQPTAQVDQIVPRLRWGACCT